VMPCTMACRRGSTAHAAGVEHSTTYWMLSKR
jgi:hypothetical protein